MAINKGNRTWLEIALLTILALIVLPTAFFAVDTIINNNVTQPLVRSRLDSDANYRRGVEVQAQGLVATFDRAQARLPLDQQTLADWEKNNPNPTSLVQTEQYANLEAQVQGDQNAMTRAETDYDALVNNPDNAGLFQFDPTLPRSLP